jgi:hypothetical protein
LGGHYLPNIQTKWRTTRGVSRRRSAKSDRNGQVRLLKKWAATNSHESGLCRPPPQSHLRKQFHALACPAIGLSEPRRHELDKFRERVAVLGAEFRQRFRE